MLDALTILGIGYGEKDVDYEERVKKWFSTKYECVFHDRSHPYHSALVRLIRRVLMNVLVNQTGILPFDYETDDSDFNDTSGVLRGKRLLERRRRRKRPSNVLKEGCIYRKEDGRTFLKRSPRDVMNALIAYTKSVGDQRLPLADEDVTISESELSGSNNATNEIGGGMAVDDSKGEITYRTSVETDPVFVTFGEYKVAATKTNDLKGRKADFGPVVCRVTIETGPEQDPNFIDVCVDSGATFCLLSIPMYEKIKRSGCCSPLKATRGKLQGASGASLNHKCL